MSLFGKWGFSRDGELYTGAFDSAEQAVQEAEASGYGRFFVGQFREPVTDGCLHADLLLEHIVCQDEYCGDYADGCFDCSGEQRSELTASLRLVFREWMDRHGLRPQFGIVDQPHEIICDGFESCAWRAE